MAAARVGFGVVIRGGGGHTDSGNEPGATATYVRATLQEVAAALAALASRPADAVLFALLTLADAHLA